MTPHPHRPELTLLDYKRSCELEEPFYALLMAAFRGADSDWNFNKLKAAFPEVYEEVYAREYAPGGLRVGEYDPETGLTRTVEGLINGDGVLVVDTCYDGGWRPPEQE